MDMEKQMQLIRAGNFKENNGSVMRTINMLRYQYHKLKSVEYALPDNKGRNYRQRELSL